MNNKKILVKVYEAHVNQEEETLSHEELIDDTEANREALVEDLGMYGCGFDVVERFIEGKTNQLQCNNLGGGWNSPNRRSIYLTSYEEEVKRIEENYKRDMEKLNKMFAK